MYDNLEFKVSLLIREISSKINLYVAEKLKTTGLTVQQITVIKLIAHNKEITVSELAEKMSVRKSTISGILDRLNKMDIIIKTRSFDDKRVTYIDFSENGQKLVEHIKNIVNKSFESTFENISKDKLEEIYKNLNFLLDNI